MQITVRLGRKTGDDLLVSSHAQILRDDVTNEVGRPFFFSGHCGKQSYRGTCRSTTFTGLSDLTFSLTPHFSEVLRNIAHSQTASAVSLDVCYKPLKRLRCNGLLLVPS